MGSIDRRKLLGGLAALAAGTQLARLAGAAESPVFSEHTLDLGRGTGFHKLARLLVPKGAAPAGGFPTVVLLHGYFPDKKPAELTAAWRDEYGVAGAVRRLSNPPVKRVLDTKSYLSDERLERINQRLAKRKFRPLALLCPVTPVPYFADRTGPLYDEFASHVVDELLPAAGKRASLAPRCAVAGVSMGALVAMECFIRKPSAFAALSSVQAAIDTRRARSYAARLAAALEPEQRVSLITSGSDRYRWANEALNKALAKRGVSAEFRRPGGPHHAAFLREIGSIELLLFCDRVLRGGTPTVAPKPQRAAKAP